ncbi:hypothetical protein ColTof3_08394 [Colletotrichum tofieldiae]|nr:hypothetical protein ColTof3_08394 [Colletotrichum tofieldiae]GKT96743.1 hypothetical protein Ct61P_14593 [Colletotrichum tofieldiae]
MGSVEEKTRSPLLPPQTSQMLCLVKNSEYLTESLWQMYDIAMTDTIQTTHQDSNGDDANDAAIVYDGNEWADDSDVSINIEHNENAKITGNESSFKYAYQDRKGSLFNPFDSPKHARTAPNASLTTRSRHCFRRAPSSKTKPLTPKRNRLSSFLGIKPYSRWPRLNAGYSRSICCEASKGFGYDLSSRPD